MNNSYNGIGLMSGTSLDGLDVVFAKFSKNTSGWQFEILTTTFVEYPAEILEKLEIAKKISSENLLKLDVAYGKWLGRKVSDFISSEKIHPDFVASHGYTVFHQPENNFTYQIGSGNEIFVECKIPVVYNFRQMDVSLGGQGAPLVPIGDQLLFGDYHYCLNLGGIANISTELFGKRIAY